MTAEIGKKPLVQIVEDDAAVRRSLSFLLQSYGYEVEAHESGQDLFDRGAPAAGCLILDYHLPGMTGLEVLGRLRAMGRSTPALLITGKVEQSIRQNAASIGIVALLEKPFEDDALVAAIEKAMASA